MTQGYTHEDLMQKITGWKHRLCSTTVSDDATFTVSSYLHAMVNTSFATHCGFGNTLPGEDSTDGTSRCSWPHFLLCRGSRHQQLSTKWPHSFLVLCTNTQLSFHLSSWEVNSSLPEQPVSHSQNHLLPDDLHKITRSPRAGHWKAGRGGTGGVVYHWHLSIFIG
jgi:hypothetical protein